MSCDVAPEVYGCEHRLARKLHKCCECGGLIPVNQHYFYHHGVWDYQGRSFKVCADCELLRIDIDATTDYPEDKVAFGELYEHVFESHNKDFIKRFMETKRTRNAEIKPWMIEREKEYG